MNNVEALFNFVKSPNWQNWDPNSQGAAHFANTSGSGSVATGDSILAIVFIALALIFIAGTFFMVLKSKTVAGGSQGTFNYHERKLLILNKYLVNVKSVIAGCAIFVSLLVVTFFSLNFLFATAETTQECSMSNINVSITNNGIESVEKAILNNESNVDVFYADTLLLESLDPAAVNSNWTFKYQGKVIFSSQPDKTVRLSDPIIIPVGGSTDFEIGIDMDPNTAVTFINRSPIRLHFSLIDEIQKQAYDEIDHQAMIIYNGTNDLSAMSQDEKNNTLHDVDIKVNLSKDSISKALNPQEISLLVDNFKKDSYNIFKNASTNNADKLILNTYSDIDSANNLDRKAKNTYKAEADKINNYFVLSMAQAVTSNDITTANTALQNSIKQLNQEIKNSEAAALWTVNFDAGEQIQVPPQQKKFGAYVNIPTSPERPGYVLEGWYTNNTFESSSKWNFESDKVGVSAGDADACHLVLFAKWESKSYRVSFDKNGHGADPVPSFKDVFYKDKYGELPIIEPVEGWDFDGWYFDAACSGKQVTEDTIVEKSADHTLYAKWSSSGPKTISFTASGCKNVPSTVANVPKGSTYQASGNTLTITGPEGSGFSKEVEVEPFDDTYEQTATWTPDSGIVNDDCTIKVSFAKTYTLNFITVNCSDDKPDPIVRIPSGSSFSTSGNKISVHSPKGEFIEEKEFAPISDSYKENPTWSETRGSITKDTTIRITFVEKTFKLSFNATGCEKPVNIDGVVYGSSFATSGNTLTVTKKDGTIITRTVVPLKGYGDTATWDPESCDEIKEDKIINVSFERSVSSNHTITIKIDKTCDSTKSDTSPITDIPDGFKFGTKDNMLSVIDTVKGEVIYVREIAPLEKYKDNKPSWSPKQGTVDKDIEISVTFESSPGPTPSATPIPLFEDFKDKIYRYYPIFECDNGQTAADLGYHFYTSSDPNDEIKGINSISQLCDEYVCRDIDLYVSVDEGMGINNSGKCLAVRWEHETLQEAAPEKDLQGGNIARKYSGKQSINPDEYWCGLSWDGCPKSDNTNIYFLNGDKAEDSGFNAKLLYKYFTKVIDGTSGFWSAVYYPNSSYENAYYCDLKSKEAWELISPDDKDVAVLFSRTFGGEESKNNDLFSSLFSFFNINNVIFNEDIDNNNDENIDVSDNASVAQVVLNEANTIKSTNTAVDATKKEETTAVVVPNENNNIPKAEQSAVVHDKQQDAPTASTTNSKEQKSGLEITSEEDIVELVNTAKAEVEELAITQNLKIISNFFMLGFSFLW